MSTRKPPPVNKPSTQLSREENEVVFKLLGPRCQTLCTAVVQVFGTETPNHNMWRKRHCGAVTFTKDNVRRSYYIQVYDVVGGTRVFEQELYNQFIYTVSKTFFHQFEAEDQMIGLNFADERESGQFSQAVNERLAAKMRKKEERRRQAEHQQRVHQPIQPEQPRLPSVPVNTTPPFVPPKDLKKKNNKKGGKNKSRLSKEQIGMPTDFKHITHVGFDPDKGLTQFNVDDKLEGFFKMVGVSEQQLSDQRTREFIYDFIEKNGGVEKAVQETQRYSSQPPPPPPPVSANNTHSHHPPPPPPPNNTMSPPTPPNLPSRMPSTRIAPPPPPRNLHHPPPPPPPNSAPPPPPLNPRAPMPPPPGQVVAGQKKSPLPPPPPSTSTIPPPPPPTSTIPTLANTGASTKAAPPPPPPMAPTPTAPRPPPLPPGGMPPAPGIGMPTAPKPPSPPGPPMSDARSALMDQIRSGSSILKKVEHVERQPITDSRSLLMDEIRGGIQLKNVKEPGEGAGAPKSDQYLEGMALQLSRALMVRAQAIQSESDESETENDDDDDDWDDDDA